MTMTSDRPAPPPGYVYPTPGAGQPPAAEPPAGEPPAGGTNRRTRRGRPARPLPPMGGVATVLLAIWVTLALLAVWVAAYAFGLSGLQEQRSQNRLYAQFRLSLTPSYAPAIGGNIAPGRPVALMRAPSIGLTDLVVVEGTASEDLRSGPGHRRDTPLPGQVGVSVVMARSVTFGGPFRDISRLQYGQQLTFVTGQGTFVYQVMDVRRPGDRLPPPLPAGQSRVVLVTSEGGGWSRAVAPTHAVFVDADLMSADVGQGAKGATPVAAPAGRPAAVPPEEQPMRGDSSVLLTLVLWLEGLLLAGVGLAWAGGRWGGRQAWLIGVPVVIALLWGTTNCAVALLPNLI